MADAPHPDHNDESPPEATVTSTKTAETSSEAVVLVGHGGVAKDTPRELVRELRMLEAKRHREGGPMSAREAELDDKVRNWPRTPRTDPYKYGIGKLAEALRPMLGDRELTIAYNEFCAPSIDTAIDALVARGITDIAVITTMFTPGGSHSEYEIPEILAAARERHPTARIRYAWPFDLQRAAAFLRDTLDTA